MAKASKKSPKMGKAMMKGGIPLSMRVGMGGPMKAKGKGAKRSVKPGAVC